MKKFRCLAALVIACPVLVAVSPAGEPAPVSLAAPAANQLTAAEKLEGWQLLFDGATFAGWRGYGLPGLPAAGWEIQEGMIKTVPNVRGGVELITERKFDDFEFSWEWRIAEGGNNGIKYFVTEARRSAPGHEYQMIDDARHPDGQRGPLYQTGAFYGVLVPAADKPLRAPGEWNVSRIIVRGKLVEHWLNGRKILAYETGSAEVKSGIAKSKFQNEPGFGDKIVGHLMITYHNDACWFRNLKVRELK
jgi:hypothetical protein